MTFCDCEKLQQYCLQRASSAAAIVLAFWMSKIEILVRRPRGVGREFFWVLMIHRRFGNTVPARYFLQYILVVTSLPAPFVEKLLVDLHCFPYATTITSNLVEAEYTFHPH